MKIGFLLLMLLRISVIDLYFYIRKKKNILIYLKIKYRYVIYVIDEKVLRGY